NEIQTMEEMAAAVKTIMEELNITSASFIGHSMGGYITMAFLEKYPDAVEKLLLLNSSPKADSEKRLKERDQVVKIVKKHKQIFVKSSIRNLFRSEEHTSELQSRFDLVCRLLLEKKKNKQTRITPSSHSVGQYPHTTDPTWLAASASSALQKAMVAVLQRHPDHTTMRRAGVHGCG